MTKFLLLQIVPFEYKIDKVFWAISLWEIRFSAATLQSGYCWWVDGALLRLLLN